VKNLLYEKITFSDQSQRPSSCSAGKWANRQTFQTAILSIPTETPAPAARAAVESKTSREASPRRSDQELQLARRIDWRFLLPEPYLGRVAYSGPETGSLPTALKHFSQSFKFISPSAENPAVYFDLVVLRLRAAADLAKAHALLVPGGFLYWELKPLPWAALLQQHRNGADHAMPKRWRRVPNLFQSQTENLARLGFGDIELYWQRPNFEACLEIIPMDDWALDYTFSRTRSDLVSRLKFAAGRTMLKSGVLSCLTPCFSLIARKP
jgi:hypothetical protein